MHPEHSVNRSALSDILLDSTPLLDVRAPQEFAKGAIPASINLPILNDNERHAVGTRYKQAGPEPATRLGHKLVSGDTRNKRIQAWAGFCEQNPRAQIMCWRGGQRSGIAQKWLSEMGISIEKVPGGYKALRHICLLALDEFAENHQIRWLIVGGKTGTAKTVLLNNLSQGLDLEGLAHHRGSAFGAHADPQPPPATFENTLAVKALKHRFASLALEDESRTIGRLAIPEAWHARMQASPIALVEATVATRADHIHQEYIVEPLAAGENPAVLRLRYADALRRITKRLGGVQHKQITQLLTEAFEDKRSHLDWITSLLNDYYDPMYEYQLTKKHRRVIFSGDFAAVLEYMQAQI